MKIYTKTGDKGTTGLLSGERILKDSLRVEAYGCVDEMNSALGVARSLNNDPILNETILELQKLLMLVMAELAQSEGSSAAYIKQEQIAKLEKSMDEMDAKLPPLQGFVIPGKSPCSAALDLARTICRRAERQIWRLARQENVGDPLLVLMNRLSDYCFLLSRYVDENR
ncbi:MAG: cob(I)yrinic acid a,c-diamide adenosyltransferase [Negativicutes bacterium]